MIEGITGEKIAKQVRKIAKERPDFVYTDQVTYGVRVDGRCSYLGRSVAEPNIGQGCIVGQALQDLGVTREEMVKADIECLSASEVIEKFGISSNDKYLRFLDTVQESQDTGYSWEQAVKNAENEAL